MARKWTPEEDDALRAACAEGLSITQTATRIGRPVSSVQGRGQILGVNWVRKPTPEIAATHRHDARARRAEFKTALMGDLEQLRAQLWQPTKVYNFGGKDNTFEEAELDQPAIADQLRLVQALTAGVATIEKLERLDADEGVADAAGMLDRIADAIRKAAEEAAEVL